MSTAPDTASKLPPMLAQYVEYKAKYPDAMLFFQVGDFYELFFEDAVTVSKILNLTLTSRDKSNPNPTPMCGVPIAVVDGYIERLVAKGYSAAIVSQIDPGESGAQKGMFARKLERIITPGVRVLSNNAPEETTPIVAAVAFDAWGESAVAFSDVQSGSVSVREGLALRALRDEVARTSPSELILPTEFEGKRIDRRLAWVRHLEELVGACALKLRVEEKGAAAGARNVQSIAGYAALSEAGKRAVRLLLQFIDETTVDRALPISAVELRSYKDVMVIDSMTRTNLELVRNIRDGSTQGSLLGVIDRTLTPGGGRTIRQWLLHPLTAAKAINDRLTAGTFLRERPVVRSDMRNHLHYMTDLERIAARLELLIISPRELGALRDSLCEIPAIEKLLTAEGTLPLLLGETVAGFHIPPALPELLGASLVDKPPPSINEGGVFKAGYDAELDRVREIKTNGHGWIAQLEARERERAGIQSLKIKFNNVIGYFIEISKANLAKVPPEYIRRQNTVNGDRFTTPELQGLEREVLGAEGRELALEKRLFENIKSQVREFVPAIRSLARAVSVLDVLCALAELADSEGLIAPVIDESGDIEIEEGRHPVIASMLGNGFIPNGLTLHRRGRSCMIVTGPNMGGKSTYLRQTALCVIMAQMGACVFAKRARIGVVDRVYARLGASDNLAEGDSTFMVEMREASHILSTATEHSLVVIDEIGRGTATMDGLSIARAILEWIVRNTRCRTLFATHFHELTTLSETYPTIGNLSVASEESEDGVIFTHHIKEGPASRSYGLEVAALAGLPAEVLDRAREVLRALEQSEDQRAGRALQLQMFTPASRAPAVPRDYENLKRLAGRLRSVDINATTPIEALNLLSELAGEAAKTK